MVADLTLIIGFIGVVLAIIIASVTVTWRISKLLDKIDRRLEKIEERVTRMEEAIQEVISPTLLIVVSKFPDISKEVLGKFQKLYFTPQRIMSNPSPAVEQRKKSLVEKARLGTITRTEATEVKNLLEKQRKQHQASGDFAGVLLSGLLIAIILGVIASLFDDSE